MEKTGDNWPGTIVRLGFRQTACLPLEPYPYGFLRTGYTALEGDRVVSQGCLHAAPSHQAWLGKPEASTSPSLADKIRPEASPLHLLCTPLEQASQSPVSAQ